MHQPPVKRSRKRTRLFAFVSLLLPFLLLFLLEMGLRIFHYGVDLSVFVEVPDNKEYLQLNPDASKRYFTEQAIATTGNKEWFKKEKDPGTLRIFVLGESTTIGYPYFHNASFHRWLQYRLGHSFPEKNFEIVNISLTAVNSYTVWGFARETVNYEPDAILIYSGHNEYYGAMGVGSTNKISGAPSLVNALLALRDLKLVQLISRMYTGIAGWFRDSPEKSGKNRMEMMVAEQQIPYGSTLFDRGIDQFRSNMDKTLALFNSRHIPVFISNVISNEKDLKPFVSMPVDSLRFPNFSRNYALGIEALESKDSVRAFEAFKEAEAAYGEHALCNFYLGRLALYRGDSAQGRVWLQKAKDLDALRFRAPEEINRSISALCQKYKYANLVDAVSAFQAHSPGGVPGDELLLEHVHPNLDGYALLSDVFYETMKSRDFFSGAFSLRKRHEMDFAQLRQSMPIPVIDSLAGAYKIFNLKRSRPFTDGKSAVLSRDTLSVISFEEQLAYSVAFREKSWPEAIDGLYNHYIADKDYAKAARLTEALTLEYPMDAALLERTANLYGESKHEEEALFYFKKSFSFLPSFEKARTLFVICFKLDRPTEAIPYLDYAIRNNTAGLNLAPVKQIATEVIRLQQASLKAPADLSLLNRIAHDYFTMGNRDGASSYVDKVLRLDPANKEALALSARLKSS